MKKVLYFRVYILRPFLVDLIAFFQEGKTLNKVKLKCNYACLFEGYAICVHLSEKVKPSIKIMTYNYNCLSFYI